MKSVRFLDPLRSGERLGEEACGSRRGLVVEAERADHHDSEADEGSQKRPVILAPQVSFAAIGISIRGEPSEVSESYNPQRREPWAQRGGFRDR